jgi:hypothetical protein
VSTAVYLHGHSTQVRGAEYLPPYFQSGSCLLEIEASSVAMHSFLVAAPQEDAFLSRRIFLIHNATRETACLSVQGLRESPGRREPVMASQSDRPRKL